MIGFVKRYVFHNFGLKVISLLLATGLWFIISRDEQPAEIAGHRPVGGQLFRRAGHLRRPNGSR